jgi:uncharacterized protein YbjQ (UPF0145 family)
MAPLFGSREMEDTVEKMRQFFNYGLPLLVLMAAYLIGSRIEKNHFVNIREREDDLHGFPVVSFDTMPDDWKVSSSDMVAGSIVISLDYFKRVIAGLRGLIGGRIKTYEPLLERARREALLRMTESARAQGYDAIFNVRLETSRLANARRDGKGIAGVEMLAFGTAVKFAGRFG